MNIAFILILKFQLLNDQKDYIKQKGQIMIGLQGEVFCLICTKQYKDDNLPRILTTCGHTYCQICISKMITKNISEQQADNGRPFIIECPEDGAKMKLTVSELKLFPVNLALVKVLQAKKSNSSFKDESFDLSKIAKQEQTQEDDQTTELISAMNYCQCSQSYQDMNKEVSQADINQLPERSAKLQAQRQLQIKQEKQEDELCLLHQKPLQIVCINDGRKICSKCAIFGQHKGHDFKSIQEVERQKNECYMKILQIFKEKQQTQQRMSNQGTKSGLVQILDRKRNLLEKQIRQEFRKLRQQITKQEQTVLRSLHDTYRNTQQRIKSLLKVDQNTLKDFASWQVQSYDLLKVLQGSQVQPKVKALYSKQHRNVKILQEGKLILSQFKQQQGHLIDKVQGILVDLECRKSRKIYQFLPGFLQIVDKPQRTIQQRPLRIQVKPRNMAVSNLIADNSQKVVMEKVSNSNCTIFDDYAQKNNHIQESPLLQQSLLDAQEKDTTGSDQIKNEVNNFSQQIDLPLRPNLNLLNKNHQQDSVSCSFTHLELESAKKIPGKNTQKKTHNDEFERFQNGRDSMILTSRPSLISKKQAGQKPTKRKLKAIRISQKYQKILEGIYNNTVDTIDLTNAQVGDQIMLQICQFVRHSKARTIKFIRNKLTDSGIQKMLPMLANAQILNLSQNNLTQGVLDIFIKHRHGYLSGLKNIILSQNKIIERKHKGKIDNLRAMNIVVSV